jgi:hypothetical protein
MLDENSAEIRRLLEILPSEIGSRRITSEQVRALLDELSSIIIRFSMFTVWRFGQHDRLEYPAKRIHEAIEHYDIKRIYGKGFIDDHEGHDAFIEIDLWAGGNLGDWNWLFRLYGPKSKVDQTAGILKEHIDRWQKTWHHWFHHIFCNWIITMFLSIIFGAQIGIFIASPKLAGGIRVAVLTYLIGFMALVLFGTGNLAPFIWFYRPGSFIEERRQWLPRLSIFAILAVAAGVAGNLIWNILTK